MYTSLQLVAEELGRREERASVFSLSILTTPLIVQSICMVNTTALGAIALLQRWVRSRSQCSFSIFSWEAKVKSCLSVLVSLKAASTTARSDRRLRNFQVK